jgi:hypothetical protein
VFYIRRIREIYQSYDNVKKAFNRLTKKRFSDSQELILKENLDFVKMARNECYSRDKLSLNNKGKDPIFLTFLGIWKLLPTFRNDLPVKLYYWFGEKTYELMKKNRENPNHSKSIMIPSFNTSLPKEDSPKDPPNDPPKDRLQESNRYNEWNDEREDRIGRQFD